MEEREAQEEADGAHTRSGSPVNAEGASAAESLPPKVVPVLRPAPEADAWSVGAPPPADDPVATALHPSSPHAASAVGEHSEASTSIPEALVTSAPDLHEAATLALTDTPRALARDPAETVTPAVAQTVAPAHRRALEHRASRGEEVPLPLAPERAPSAEFSAHPYEPAEWADGAAYPANVEQAAAAEGLSAVRPSLRETLAEPFRWWTAALIFSSALVTVVAAALLGLAFSHGEWATGARAAGVAGLAICAVYLLGTLVRAVAGRRTLQAILLGLTAALLLGLIGDASFALITPLHQTQARALEAMHSWDLALHEFSAGGEHGPASVDLARVNVEWGDALLRQGQYPSALDRYLTVLVTYPRVPRETAPAISGLLRAYAAWLNTNRGDLPYDGMVLQLVQDRQASWCDANCRAAVARLQAQVYYQDGVLLAQAGKYVQATTQFETVTAQFASSPFAGRAHLAAATTYFAIGQAQKAGPSCTDALPTYQKLAAQFSDTPEGAAAQTALAAPQDVTGTLQEYPTTPAPTMYLSRQVTASTYFSDDYSASLNSSGQFTFTNVAQGSYNLSAAFANGSGVHWYDAQTGNPYNVIVGPLCTLQLPTYSWS